MLMSSSNGMSLSLSDGIMITIQCPIRWERSVEVMCVGYDIERTKRALGDLQLHKCHFMSCISTKSSSPRPAALPWSRQDSGTLNPEVHSWSNLGKIPF